MSLNYHSIDKEGHEAGTEISKRVDSISDVFHLEGWNKEVYNDRLYYTYNNTEKTDLPPLYIMVIDDDMIKLLTTAYGEKTVQSGSRKLAQKHTAKDESATEWIENKLIFE